MQRREANQRGQAIGTVVNVFGGLISRTVSEGGYTLDQTVSTTGFFGRITRTDYLDGTSELFEDLQWHGGPATHRLRDGSQATLSYEWDVNDRMAAVQTASGAPGTVEERLEFAYDYQGRRVSRETYTGSRTRSRRRPFALPVWLQQQGP